MEYKEKVWKWSLYGASLKVEYKEQVWNWSQKSKFESGVKLASLKVETIKSKFESGVYRASVKVESKYQVWWRSLKSKSESGFIKASLKVDLSKQVWEWIQNNKSESGVYRILGWLNLYVHLLIVKWVLPSLKWTEIETSKIASSCCATKLPQLVVVLKMSERYRPTAIILKNWTHWQCHIDFVE